jgi:hypothetical protein
VCAELLAAAAAVDASDEAQIICTHSRPRACVRPRTPTKVIYGQLGSATSGWKGRRNGLTGASSLSYSAAVQRGGLHATRERICTETPCASARPGGAGLPCMQPWWEGSPTCGLRASRPVNMLFEKVTEQVRGNFSIFEARANATRWRQCTTRARACAACTRCYSRGGRRQRCAHRRRGRFVVACAWCSAFGAGAISLDPHQAPRGGGRCQRLQEPLGMRAQCAPAVCHPAPHRPAEQGWG